MKEKALVEAVIFASRGITIRRLSKITGIDEERLKSTVQSIERDYSSKDRGIELREIEGRYRFYTK